MEKQLSPPAAAGYGGIEAIQQAGLSAACSSAPPIELQQCRCGKIASRSLQRFRHAIAVRTSPFSWPSSCVTSSAACRCSPTDAHPCRRTKFEDGEDVATLSKPSQLFGDKTPAVWQCCCGAAFSTRALSSIQCQIFAVRALHCASLPCIQHSGPPALTRYLLLTALHLRAEICPTSNTTKLPALLFLVPVTG
jgi:hypothetical protein